MKMDTRGFLHLLNRKEMGSTEWELTRLLHEHTKFQLVLKNYVRSIYKYADVTCE